MKFTIETKINIKSSPEKTWQVLTQFSEYHSWNPFIKSIKGEVQKGNQIEVNIVPPGEKGMTFKPVVTSYIENQEISWLGQFLFPKLLDGEHKFQIIDNKDETITFVHGETFNGILVPLLKKKLNGSTKEGFIEMNKKLKEILEQ